MYLVINLHISNAKRKFMDQNRPAVKDRGSTMKLLYASSFSFLVLSLLFLAPEQALCGLEGTDDLHKPRADKTLLRGIDLLYNRQFRGAEQLFRRVVAESPQRPAGYFYLSMVTWSRLAAGFWSSETVDEYKRRIDRAIDVAQARLDDEEADSYDFFYLGGALGFKGRFELMGGNWLSSFFLATDAIDALKACLKIDPDNRDVLLGIGTFDYYTARLSGVLKFLTYFLLHRGNKEEGMRKLNIAANEALYSATEAKSVLLHIYLFLEEDFSKALSLSNELAARYKENPRFKILKGVSYIRLGMDPEYRKTVSELRNLGSESSGPEMSLIWERRALYLESIYDLFHFRYLEAREKIKKVLEYQDPLNDPTMIAWPLIKLGMSYDLEGDRDQAKEYYDRVLNMKNGSGAQFLAEKLLKGPPKKGDPFLGY